MYLERRKEVLSIFREEEEDFSVFRVEKRDLSLFRGLEWDLSTFDSVLCIFREKKRGFECI